VQNGEQALKLALLGADRIGFGTTVLVSIGCSMLRQCHLAGPQPGDTTGTRRLGCTPGVATVIAGATSVLLDQRHIDAAELAAMLAEARASGDEAASAEQCTVEWERIWQIAPIPFDQDLIAAARSACLALSGTDHALPSGPLHDAAEMARVVPAVMIFSSSTNGISHAKEEDTPLEHLDLAIRAYAHTVSYAIDRVAAG
jgi:N-carbamoyl-L-amino-acid hydrolase